MTLPTRPDGGIDWEKLGEVDASADLSINVVAVTLIGVRLAKETAAHTRERCAMKALEQRCERGIPWDRACVAIAAAIRKMED